MRLRRRSRLRPPTPRPPAPLRALVQPRLRRPPSPPPPPDRLPHRRRAAESRPPLHRPAALRHRPPGAPGRGLSRGQALAVQKAARCPVGLSLEVARAWALLVATRSHHTEVAASPVGAGSIMRPTTSSTTRGPLPADRDRARRRRSPTRRDLKPTCLSCGGLEKKLTHSAVGCLWGIYLLISQRMNSKDCLLNTENPEKFLSTKAKGSGSLSLNLEPWLKSPKLSLMILP